MQGARCGTRSPVSRITPWAEGGAKPLSHPGCPGSLLLIRIDTGDQTVPSRDVLGVAVFRAIRGSLAPSLHFEVSFSALFCLLTPAGLSPFPGRQDHARRQDHACRDGAACPWDYSPFACSCDPEHFALWPSGAQKQIFASSWCLPPSVTLQFLGPDSRSGAVPETNTVII